MKKVICICIMAWMFLLGSAQAKQAPDETASKVNNEIPFELRDGFLIVVQGRIAKHEDLKFVLDTGATYSVVNRKLAERLSARRRTGRILNFNKTLAAEFAEFGEVQFGPIEVHNALLMIADLENSSHTEQVDAIIGLDLLCVSKRLLIDYGARKISFRAGSADLRSDSAQQIPPFLLMQVMVQGHPMRLLVDSGMRGILLYEDRLRKMLPNLKLQGERRGVRIGYLQVKQVSLPGVLLGERELERTVFLMKGRPADGLEGIDGYIGTSALGAQRVEFDFERNTLALVE